MLVLGQGFKLPEYSFNSMTNERSQRQYGRSVNMHCKDESIHSESGNASFYGSVIQDSFSK